MTKRRITIDNDHLTVVCTRKVFGLFWYNKLVANHEENIEETMMHSETYSTKSNAVAAATTLGKNLGIKVLIQE